MSLDKVCWEATSGASSLGTEFGFEEKIEPPFFVAVRDLSSSAGISLCQLGQSGYRTINSRLDCFLDWDLKNLPCSPYLHNSSQLLLNLICSPFVCGRGSFGNDWREGNEEIILAASFRLLCNFYNCRSY
jgi:hypothetical protein